MDNSLPGSFVHRISQVRILQWVANSFSRGLSQPRDRTCMPRSSVLTEVFTTEPPGQPQDDSSSFQTLWGVMVNVHCMGIYIQVGYRVLPCLLELPIS